MIAMHWSANLEAMILHYRLSHRELSIKNRQVAGFLYEWHKISLLNSQARNLYKKSVDAFKGRG